MSNLIGVFAACWGLALLWLVLMRQLLGRLLEADPELYEQLGRPVMRWLWWSWPTPGPGAAPMLNLAALGRGSVELQTMLTPEQLRSTWKLLCWIAVSRPRLSLDARCRRLQRQLRLCGVGFGIGFVLLLILAITAS